MNSVILGGISASYVNVAAGGAAAGHGGGVRAIGCTMMARGTGITTASGTSTIFPCVLQDSLVVAAAGQLAVANTSGQIVESFNVYIGTGTARSNVTAGTGTIIDGSYAPLIHFGQERIWANPNGVPLFKPLGEPMQSSPFLGFGSPDPVASLPLDLLTLARPAGLASPLPAVGALERHNNWIPDPAPIGDGSTPIKFTGPGDQAFIVPVPARAITITVKVAWDATYSGTKPQLQLDANAAIGVTAQTVTAVGSGTVETLTLAAFTPTAAGKQVVVRVRSNDLTGSAVVEADQFTVSG